MQFLKKCNTMISLKKKNLLQISIKNINFDVIFFIWWIIWNWIYSSLGEFLKIINAIIKWS